MVSLFLKMKQSVICMQVKESVVFIAIVLMCFHCNVLIFVHYVCNVFLFFKNHEKIKNYKNIKT